MFTHLFCQCQICDHCIAQSVTVTVKEKNIRDLVCPMCQQPEVLDEETSIPHFQHIEHKVICLSIYSILSAKDTLLSPDLNFIRQRIHL